MLKPLSLKEQEEKKLKKVIKKKKKKEGTRVQKEMTFGGAVQL